LNSLKIIQKEFKLCFEVQNLSLNFCLKVLGLNFKYLNQIPKFSSFEKIPINLGLKLICFVFNSKVWLEKFKTLCFEPNLFLIKKLINSAAQTPFTYFGPKLLFISTQQTTISFFPLLPALAFGRPTSLASPTHPRVCAPAPSGEVVPLK
jgi:hypothetical protein